MVDDNNGTYKGCPTLINQTPDNIIQKLVMGFNKVDDNIIKTINTIEYNPYIDSDGKTIDETRFKLVMNDYNTVMIDTVNIKKLNEYFDIYISLNMQETKGLLYLDTITDDNILFESYKFTFSISRSSSGKSCITVSYTILKSTLSIYLHPVL